MNILGGKDVLKFFSKNKKGVSVPEEYEKKFPNANIKRIRKDNIVVHSSGICADGKFYNTENAEKIFSDNIDYDHYGYTCYSEKTYFLTAKGNWFSAFTVINCFREENQEENTITTWKHIVYGSLQIEDKENIKMLLGNKDIDLYKKYFGEVEEG